MKARVWVTGGGVVCIMTLPGDTTPTTAEAWLEFFAMLAKLSIEQTLVLLTLAVVLERQER